MMGIDQEFVQNQLAILRQELGNLMEQASEVRGAIMLCEVFARHLELPKPEEKEEDNTSSLED